MGLPKKTGEPPRTMAETKYCSSCSKTKPADEFIHPRTGKDGATCAECIIKRSAAAKRTAPVDTAATLQLHTSRLDDHEGRIACVEDAVFEDAPLGAPAAPDAGTFTKSQLRRQRRRNKKAGRAAARALDFVLVGNDAASDSTTDLDSLASTHSCVRALVEENRQLSAGLRGMRLLLRDPSARLLQRVGRGMMGRRRAKSRFAAVRKIQAMVRRRAKRKFAAAVEIQKIVRGLPCVALRLKCLRASVVIAAALRRYHVLSATPLGRLLSKTRRLAKELTETKVALVAEEKKKEELLRLRALALQRLNSEVTIVKREKDEAQAKLTKANEQLAANERELKNAVHATLCDPGYHASAARPVRDKNAGPITKVCSTILRALQNPKDSYGHSLKPAVAQIITRDLTVEVTGATLFATSPQYWKNSPAGKQWLSANRDKKIPGIVRYHEKSGYDYCRPGYKFFQTQANGEVTTFNGEYPILSADQFEIVY